MERIRVLIDKLAEQNRTGSSPSQLLMTVQLLQAELLTLQQGPATAATKKVAVIMPAHMAPAAMPTAPEAIKEEPRRLEIKKQEQLHPEVVKEYPVNSESYFLRKPSAEESPMKEAVKEETVQHFPFDAMAETPTLLQQRGKEVHEAIGERRESLNDKLKQEKTELGHQLKDTPVKDLRKAIGINDKFLFVNELFRGDEGMYDRSIKTINNFHILPEAEYWINRELKVKLGWNDNKDTVQHFYSLVRRRFS